MGNFTIQLARILGLNIITTCSPRNFDQVKSLGASHSYDYRDPDVVAKIIKDVPDLKYAFDTIGNSTSSTMAAQSMGQSKGNVCTVRPGKQFTEDVPKHILVTDVLVFTAFLKEHVYKEVFKWPVRTQCLLHGSRKDADTGNDRSTLKTTSSPLSYIKLCPNGSRPASSSRSALEIWAS